MGILVLLHVSSVNCFLQFVTIEKADLHGVCTDLHRGVLFFLLFQLLLWQVVCASVSELSFFRAGLV